MGSYLFLSNRRSFHDESVERVRTPFFFSLAIIPIDPVRCGFAPFACLVFWFHFYDSRCCYGEWIKGRWIPCPFPPFWFFVFKLLYACTYSTVAFLGSRGDNRTAKNPGDVLVHLVHLGCGTLQVVWALVFLCVTLSDSPSLTMASGWEEVDHSPFLLSLFHPLLALANYNGVWIERDRNFSCS